MASPQDGFPSSALPASALESLSSTGFLSVAVAV